MISWTFGPAPPPHIHISQPFLHSLGPLSVTRMFITTIALTKWPPCWAALHLGGSFAHSMGYSPYVLLPDAARGDILALQVSIALSHL